MKRFKYCGDINIEHGGYFYSAAEWKHGYAEAVRVVPCSDAGAQDNCYWIEELTVLIPDSNEKLLDVLKVCGWSVDGNGNIYDSHSNTDIADRGTAAYRAAVIDACIAHGAYDQDSSTCVSIGKPDPEYRGREPIEPDTVLRANTSLERYVRRNYLRNR